MKPRNSFKKQVAGFFLTFTLIFFAGFYGLDAQSNYTYFAYHQGSSKIIQSDTTLLNTQVIEKHVSKENEILKQKVHYMSFMSLGLLPGSQDVITTTPVSLAMSHGFFDPSGLYIGGGLAVETFDPSLMPLFFDVKGFFTGGSIKPWIGAKIGYAIPLSNRQDYHEKGGIYAGAGGGMVFSISSRAGFYFYFGYRYQKLESTLIDYFGEETKIYTEFNRMEFRLGLSFH